MTTALIKAKSIERKEHPTKWQVGPRIELALPLSCMRSLKGKKEVTTQNVQKERLLHQICGWDDSLSRILLVKFCAQLGHVCSADISHRSW
eukprot:3463392-Amphidinium_carterae.1